MSRNDSIRHDQKHTFERAVAAFRNGNPVCIHDAADREGETDLVYPASDVTPMDVTRMRNDAGGLVCVALGYDVAEAFDLPFAQDTLEHPAVRDHDLEYDDRSSFSLTVNHRETFTGITDEDRALTISELGSVATAPGTTNFSEQFRIPGHIHLLKAAPNLLADRRGHTELAITLAAAADREPAAVVCEMLDDETKRALSPTAARTYAERNDIPYLEGATIIDHFESRR
ncbi:3,4-dihydroxy-2-butanone-4-phosphate synthase [Natronolimnohabitans sp. A-GB9]|uniref:3,4-dihydroxy-2-butanone-4-phosphate synthase n=1 Tax=Natronolimnohabitans sp. A-GB9 TaxID=3069757 RepID=UPI0027B296D4|nr:3,4-dihydroxy-2-butanone-4-phosphate synthase [Natronolimnohabitans sp. A-GB9]MDQ2052174.1 3,4-dihydroxy-2-butanone-4-phosphate synthase [Natronolimnohabitans sp. A-GB9]